MFDRFLNRCRSVCKVDPYFMVLALLVGKIILVIVLMCAISRICLDEVIVAARACNTFNVFNNCVENRLRDF